MIDECEQAQEDMSCHSVRSSQLLKGKNIFALKVCLTCNYTWTWPIHHLPCRQIQNLNDFDEQPAVLCHEQHRNIYSLSITIIYFS